MLTKNKPFSKKIIDYDKFTKQKRQKSGEGETCKCYICIEVKDRKQNMRHLNHLPKPGPKSSPKKTVSQIKICSKCGQKIGRGIRHHCSPGKQAKNLTSLANSQGVKEQMASSVISDMAPNEDGDISLKTGGRQLRVRMKPKPKKLNILTHEQLDKFHSKVTGNDMDTDLLAQGWRQVNGRKSVQPHYRSHRKDKKQTCEFFLESVALKLNGRNDTRKACVMRNPRDYIEHIKIARGITNHHARFGMDGGGKWLKLTLNIMDKDEQPPTNKRKDLFEKDFKDTGI